MNAKMIVDYVKGRYLNRYLGEKGQGIVEYALILGFVVAIAVAVLDNDGTLYTAISNKFNDVVTTLGGGTQNQGN